MIEMFGPSITNKEREYVLDALDNINDTQESDCAKFNMTLWLGMNNAEVKCLQKKLNEKGFKVKGTEMNKETTYFGFGTYKALKEFQVKNKLIPDGVFGPLSREVLKDTQ